MSAPPDWAYDRVNQLRADFTGDSYNPTLAADYADLKGAFARYVAEHEEPPVEPLLIEARKLCDDAYPMRSAVGGSFINGGGDGTISMRLALEALKRGIEIGKSQ